MVNNFIFPLAVLGLAIASYLYYKNAKHEKLVCVMGEDCNAVVHSKYSKLFGIQLEYLGVIYYSALTALSAFLTFSVEPTAQISLSFVLLGLTVLGSIFYLMFIYIQFFKIKKWCSYCLTSALVTFVILFLQIGY